MTVLELTFAPRRVFERVLACDPSIDRTRAFAALARLNTLSMIKEAGSGHIGSSFSSLELVTWIHLEGLRRQSPPERGFEDIYFSSKGHDAPALYAVLIGLGLLEEKLLHRLRRLGGLPGHPDVNTPHILTNTGSLGMGISKARGMILADRLQSKDTRAFVLTGDGELQEGQFWESLQPTVNRGLHELTVVIDHNKMQSDTWVERVSDLGDLEGKLRAFGWRVSRVPGHDLEAIDAVLGRPGTPGDAPHMVIADTVKGSGVSFMESVAFERDVKFYPFHSGAPSQEHYLEAADELVSSIRCALLALGIEAIEFDTAPLPTAPSSTASPPPATAPQRLVAAYGRALVEQAERRPDLVALDADLVLDTGLTSFSQKFPERFFECGIAEMDMVSQAGGMALRGLLPVVHSFACFLSTRPNEQIYTNATERTKIIYVGSLAGLLPGGPGHSHQSVRDVSALGGVPGLCLVQPATESETAALLDYCVHGTDRSSYLRLVSIPCDVPFELPDDHRVVPGRGTTVHQGSDAVLIAAGPVMLSEAYRAAELLEEQGLGLRVVNLPWLNQVDLEWLIGTLAGCDLLFTLDDQYLAGGQGAMLAAAIAGQSRWTGTVVPLGVREIPRCGTNREVLAAHGLDAESLCRTVLGALERA